MQKALILSVLLSSLLLAQEAEQDTWVQTQEVQTVEPMVVKPIIIQPVVIKPVEEEPEQKKLVCPEAKVAPEDMQKPPRQTRPSAYKSIRINVVGQGVAPTMTSSPAQAYALAKRAAIADAYRLIAEKVKGVRIEGNDKIRNMMVVRSEVRTFVDAVIAEAEIVDTVFKDGLCEVEMELTIDPNEWKSILASR